MLCSSEMGGVIFTKKMERRVPSDRERERERQREREREREKQTDRQTDRENPEDPGHPGPVFWFGFCCCDKTLTTSNLGKKGFI